MLQDNNSTVVEDVTAKVAGHPEFSGHEKVFLVTDAPSGLNAKIFIHSLIEGRALGGCRRWPYESAAQWDADGLRLSRGMMRKSAVAGLPLGGAKAAISCEGNPTPAMMRAFGRGIATIEKTYGMSYITAEDVGITEDLLKEVKKETANVRGIMPEHTGGEELSGGDPGPFTAWGVFTGMQTAVRHKLGKTNMTGVTVAVQGLGDVGYYLCEFLHEAGAKLFVADLDGGRVQRVVDEFGAMPVKVQDIAAMEVDIFAPCAMGGSLNDTIRAKIVAGSANNQQKDEITNAESKMLRDKGILYAPDYVINSGGLISVYYEGETREAIMTMIGRQVEMTLDRIFTLTKKEGVDTATIADDLAARMLKEKKSFEDIVKARMAA